MVSQERVYNSDNFSLEKEEGKHRDKCGIVGIFHPDEDVARSVFYALYALQHRGQESAGIASSAQEGLRIFRNLGLVSQVFKEETIESLSGSFAVGHTRYSNTGSNNIENSQPFLTDCELGEIAICHNGNIINSSSVREKISHPLNTSSDSADVLRLVAESEGKNWEEKIKNATSQLVGAYSLIFLTRDKLIGVRDPFGIRPLCFGTYNGDGFVLASESPALDTIGANFVREIEPGEIISIDRNGIDRDFLERDKQALCIFEFIYYARPASILEGKYVAEARLEMGKILADEHPVEADLVVAVPDSGQWAAIGYSKRSGIELLPVLEKNRYIGRTFIEPDQRIRDLGVYLKLTTIRSLIDGKRVVVVDDSIVRGTTTPKVVRMLKEAGAKEVHGRISSPPIISPCFLGIDTATPEELIAFQKNGNVEEIRKSIGVDSLDSLGYLSLTGTAKAIGKSLEIFCHGCFSGEYPMPVPQARDKLVLAR